MKAPFLKLTNTESRALHRPWFNLKSVVVFALLISVLATKKAVAQYVPDYGQQTASPSQPAAPKFWDRVVPFGNFGMSFSSNYSFVDVSPGLLYAFTPKFQAGAGANYLYRSFDYGNNFKLSSSNYGGRLVGRYTVYKNIFAAAEYMLLNVETYKDIASQETERVWFNNPSVGGGAYLPIGGRSAFSISVMYMLNNDQRLNPYRNFLGLGNWNIQLGISL